MMVCNGNASDHLGLWLKAIFTAIFCNVYIVGINQIVDVELDKINKPFLPIAAGELTLKQARQIVYVCFAAALIISYSIFPFLSIVVGSAMGIGWAYSCPPLSLRKHHLPAALCISIVRGVLLNLGAFRAFNLIIQNIDHFSSDIIILSVFTTAFSIVIAWYKDLPDINGDSIFKIKSLAILYSPKTVVYAGHFLLIPVYVISIFFYRHFTLMCWGHIFLLLMFILNTIVLKTKETPDYKAYYKRFWYLFFAEYILYLIHFWN